MNKARSRSHISEGYWENHHITPRCMGGSDLSDNIVRLTAREHFIAHALLYKHYGTSSLAHAWFRMTISSKNQKRYSSRLFAAARRAHSDHLSETMSGSGNPYFGKRHSAEIRRRISDRVKAAQSKPTADQLKARSAFIEQSKRPKSTNHRKKIGRKGLLMVYNPETMVYNRISMADKQKYLDDGWVIPDHRQSKITCKVCGLTATAGNIKRWHGDNCTQSGKYQDPSRKTSRKMIPVKIAGVEYRSIRQASEELNIPKSKVKKLNENQID